MRGKLHLHLSFGMLFLVSVTVPSMATEYSIRFGELHGPAGNQTVSTTRIVKLCNKPTGYRFGYQIIPDDNAKYEYLTVFHSPAPPNVTFKDANVSSNGTLVRTAAETVQGRSVASYHFDSGDPAGKWKIDVVIDNHTVQTIDFDVVTVSRCP